MPAFPVPDLSSPVLHMGSWNPVIKSPLHT